MGIVRFALRLPHTFYALAGLVLFLVCSAVLVAPKDIFPAIDIPVVTVIWQHTGLTPEETEERGVWCGAAGGPPSKQTANATTSCVCSSPPAICRD